MTRSLRKWLRLWNTATLEAVEVQRSQLNEQSQTQHFISISIVRNTGEGVGKRHFVPFSSGHDI
jgi:hypothetical protein